MSNKYPGGLVTLNPPAQNPALGAATPGIWTIDEALNAETNRSWPMYDPYYNQVVLNLHGNQPGGVVATQNNTFLDSSSNNFTITRNGNTTQGSFNPYRQNGYWSINFNRSRIDSTLTGQAPGTGSFTYELFFNVTVKDAAIANVAALFSTRGGGTGADGFDVEITTAGAVLIGTSGSTLFTSSSGLVTNGLWYHLAIVRNGTTNWTIYLNGSSIGTISNSTNFTSVDLYLGVYGGASQDWFKGYISNFRYTRSAVYTGSFTPSTSPLTVLSDTEFLSCQSNRLIDNSPNNFAVTAVAVNGSSSVQPFSPFNQNLPYESSRLGGSGYFDGSSDYLTISSGNITNLSSSANWTVEAWVCPTASTAGVYSHVLFGSGFSFGLYNNIPQVTNNAIGIVAGSTALSLNAWTHMSLVNVASTSLKLYVNGVEVGSTSATSFTATTTYVGANSSGTQGWFGYISNLRVIDGAAVYTGAFAPPTLTPLGTTCANSVSAYPSTTNVNISSTTGASLLLGYTNAAIFDNAAMNDLETVGNAQISTSVKKYGTGSIAFDGTDDSLIAPYSPNYQLGTGDFTVEFWVNASASGSYTQTIGTQNVNADDGTWRIGNRFNNTNYLYFSRGNGTSFNENTYNSNVNDGNWHHVAFVRASGITTLYVDGSSVAPATGSTSNLSGTCSSNNQLRLGINPRDNAYFTGYLDDVRITKGVARYTAAFTPPTSQLQDQ